MYLVLEQFKQSFFKKNVSHIKKKRDFLTLKS